MAEDELVMEISNEMEADMWEERLDELEQIMDEINPDSDAWEIQGSRIGWRNLEGFKKVNADTADDLLDSITPNTSWHGRIYANFSNNPCIKIILSHHDSPTGESYSIYPADICWWKGEIITEDDDYIDVPKWYIKENLQSWEEYSPKKVMIYSIDEYGDIIELYDSGPGNMDRYTLVINEDAMFAMSEDATSAGGVNMYAGDYSEISALSTLGDKILSSSDWDKSTDRPFQKLKRNKPELYKAIANRYFEYI